MDDYTPFQLSDLTLDQAEDMLKHTLAVLYTKEAARGVPTNRSTDSNSTAEIVPGVDGFHTMASTVGHLMYNDQWPSGKTCSACGHTKGVLGFDVNGGFWLVHSTPRFPLEPSIEAFYSFPANERIYGQSYLCITLPFSAIEKVAGQLLLNYPAVYDSNVPTSLAQQLPTVMDVIKGTHVTASASKVTAIKSQGGLTFTSYAKTAKWAKDVYEDLVAPNIDAGVLTETWMRPKLDSFCPPKYLYPSRNVLTVTIDADATWKYTKDHAKWCVSDDAATKVVCIGDINHQASQCNRAGGTVCMTHPDVYEVFSKLVSDSDKC